MHTEKILQLTARMEPDPRSGSVLKKEDAKVAKTCGIRVGTVHANSSRERLTVIDGTFELIPGLRREYWECGQMSAWMSVSVNI